MIKAARYRWAVLATGASVQVVMTLPTQGLASVAPAIQHQFHVSLVQTGLLLTAANIGVATSMLAWGFLADRFTERWALTVGLTLAAIAIAVAAAEHTYAAVVVTLALAGMFGAVANAGSGRALMAWFSSSELGLALGIRQMAAPVGGAVGSLLLPFVLFDFGLPGAFRAIAACVAASALTAAVVLRVGDPKRPGASKPTVTGSALRDTRLWRLTAAAALLVATQMAFITYLTLFLTQVKGFGVIAAAGTLAAVQFGGGVARVVVGRVSDRLGRRIAPFRWLTLAACACLVVVAAAALAPSLPVLVLLLVTGWLLTMAFGLNYTATAEMVGRARVGTAFGFQGMLTSAGAVVGPAAFGLTVAAAGWRFGYLMLALVSLAIWAVLAPLVQEEARDWAPREAAQATS